MKTIAAFVGGIIFTSLISATIIYDLKKSSAEVNMEKGYYIFIECTPSKSFKKVGSIKKRVNWSGSGQFDDIKHDLVNKAKRLYPDGEGLIFDFKDGGADEVQVIRFE